MHFRTQRIRIVWWVRRTAEPPAGLAAQNNNFAPRLAIAYSPQSDAGLGSKILGKGGVFRAGASIAYDRFGSDMVVQYDNQNPFGLDGKRCAGFLHFLHQSALQRNASCAARRFRAHLPLYARQCGLRRRYLCGNRVRSEDALRLCDECVHRSAFEGRNDPGSRLPRPSFAQLADAAGRRRRRLEFQRSRPADLLWPKPRATCAACICNSPTTTRT